MGRLTGGVRAIGRDLLSTTGGTCLRGPPGRDCCASAGTYSTGWFRWSSICTPLPGRAARVRGIDRRVGGGAAWSRWLLAMPDTVVVFLASLTLSVWDKSRMAQRSRRGRRRKVGAAPDAALAAYIGMAGTRSAMLLMMVA
ncbi:hypothetical protein [Streptomyces sp. CdTB01]|uniref:hypothetical protein n=1 Tax=Streptomyces sp. CdTB01 TaxID=1725411 RepID=UPI000A6C4573|nr:hypothetical protein [Streptomyces sp. CdTB01]